MKVKVVETIKKEREIEVEFPLFRAFEVWSGSGEDSVYYTRIDCMKAEGDKPKTLRSIEIHLDGADKASIEIDHDYRLDAVDLGLDETAVHGRSRVSSQEEFDQATRQLDRLLGIAVTSLCF